jgi:hypothetical protein|tara:strand:- start:43 stop:357 length:315 start_codon:yes stop_codon:yes gene_type:complete
MIDFPDSMPTDAIVTLIDKLRGKDVPIKLVYQAAWNVAGYGIEQVVQNQKPIVKNSEPRTDEDDALTLESFLAMQGNNEEGLKAFVPWWLIIAIAVRVLKNVLE